LGGFAEAKFSQISNEEEGKDPANGRDNVHLTEESRGFGKGGWGFASGKWVAKRDGHYERTTRGVIDFSTVQSTR
jgi:hypothetical protein